MISTRKLTTALLALVVAVSYSEASYLPDGGCICPANECNFFLPPEMRYNCPNGHITDDCDCVTSCQCAGCPAFNETFPCPNGRRYDANGCPMDECYPCVCPANECGFGAPSDTWYACPDGNVVDECGCVTSCQCAGCPSVDDSVECPNGRLYEEDGCPSNFCAPPSVDCPVKDCGLLPPDMAYTCPNGHATDDCGCVTDCQCAGCPTIDQTLSCPRGRKYDASGCPLDECLEAVVKPGYCPTYGNGGNIRCEHDGDCSSTKKCCMFHGQMVCRRPLKYQLDLSHFFGS